MIRTMLAAIMIAVSPIAPAVPSHAQTSGASQSDLDAMLSWMAAFRPIAEGSYNILDPLDNADEDFYAYLDGDLAEREFLQRLDGYAQNIQERTDDWIARFEALPPAPNVMVTKDGYGFRESMAEFPKLLNTLNETSLSAIETYREAVSGDEESLQRVEAIQFDKTIAFIQSISAIAESEKVLITDNDHPQLSVINCVVHSNEATLHILRYQRSATLGESEAVLSGHLGRLRDRVNAYADEIDNGKTRQKKMITKLSLGERLAPIADRPLIKTVRSAMEDYSLAWDVEQKIVNAFKSTADGIENARTPEAMQDKIDALFVAVVPLEEERQRLMFDRLAKMQK